MNLQDAKGAKTIEPDEVVDDVARQVVDAALAVHRALGPGLLESIYEQCLARELEMRGVPHARQVAVPVRYRGLELEGGFRIDLLVGGVVVVEVKAVEQLLPIHEAQLLTYLKLTNLRVGLLINFNVPLLKHGIRRLIAPV
ncbi:MAG: GxxExxY protein [Acetobacteraceae bacterium]|nr:GxxExxY protein [Acetobacteraceae bacterium]